MFQWQTRANVGQSEEFVASMCSKQTAAADGPQLKFPQNSFALQNFLFTQQAITYNTQTVFVQMSKKQKTTFSEGPAHVLVSNTPRFGQRKIRHRRSTSRVSEAVESKSAQKRQGAGWTYLVLLPYPGGGAVSPSQALGSRTWG